MQEAMTRAVSEVMKEFSEKSSEYVQSEMEQLTKKPTRSTIGYSGLSQRRLMALEQRRAYNVFAP
jgi:hypothetical protein